MFRKSFRYDAIDENSLFTEGATDGHFTREITSMTAGFDSNSFEIVLSCKKVGCHENSITLCPRYF